jgi:hypothetical protein
MRCSKFAIRSARVTAALLLLLVEVTLKAMGCFFAQSCKVQIVKLVPHPWGVDCADSVPEFHAGDCVAIGQLVALFAGLGFGEVDPIDQDSENDAHDTAPLTRSLVLPETHVTLNPLRSTAFPAAPPEPLAAVSTKSQPEV